jgi:hypothetical protein
MSLRAMPCVASSGYKVRAFAMKQCGWCKRSAGSSWEVSQSKRQRMGVGFGLTDEHVEQFPTPADHAKAMATCPEL